MHYYSQWDRDRLEDHEFVIGLIRVYMPKDYNVADVEMARDFLDLLIERAGRDISVARCCLTCSRNCQISNR